MLQAVPIYPGTKKFPLLFVAEDEESPLKLTAYGVTPGAKPTDLCFYCDTTHPEIMCEHGMTGAPPEGVPVHLMCLLTGGGQIVSRDAVTLFLEVV